VADLERTIGVDAERVKVAVVLCPKDQATCYGWITRRQCDFYFDISVVKNVRLIQNALSCVERGLENQFALFHAQYIAGCAPTRIQVSEVILVQNIPAENRLSRSQQTECADQRNGE